MNRTATIIGKCKKEIISKYLGNDNFNLKHTDFLKLSDEIYNETNISISISTLRRIFKDNFNGYPQISTLDAFAIYLGYKDWNAYLKDNEILHTNDIWDEKKHFKVSKKLLIWVSVAILLISGLFAIYKLANPFKPNYSDIEFSYLSFDVNEMPVTVFFKYNLKGIKCDSASIQPLGRATSAKGDEFKIDLNDTIASYNYLWPETFYAKLAIDGKVVKELKIELVTNKWKASISNMKDVFYIKYFNDEEIYTKGKLAFTDKVLLNNKFQKSDIEKTVFHLIKKFKNIDGDTLTFKTRIKNNLLVRTEKGGSFALLLIFENSQVYLPVALEKSITEELQFQPFDTFFSSKNTNLSFLYVNLEEWNTLAIKTHAKKFELSINDSIAFKTDFKVNPGKLIGLRYMFNGMGEVDYVKFYNSNNELIYNDEFD